MVAEWFKQTGVWVATALGGTSLAGVLGFVIWYTLKSAFTKSNKQVVELNRQLAKETSDIAVEKGLGAIKVQVHKHDIQPLVEERMREVAKISSEAQTKELKEIKENQQKMVVIMEKVAKLFDDSYYISDEAKAELNEAIEDAKEISVEPVESKVSVEETKEEPKTEKEPQKESQKTTIER